jgi:hypothetical protein
VKQTCRFRHPATMSGMVIADEKQIDSVMAAIIIEKSYLQIFMDILFFLVQS